MRTWQRGHIAVYEAAFRGSAGTPSVFERHAAKAGYRGVAGFDRTARWSAIAYGYLAHTGLVDRYGPAPPRGRRAAGGGVDAFAIAEVAVMPAYQGRGVGSRLVDDLIARIDARHVRCSVSTPTMRSRATCTRSAASSC